MVDPVKLVLLGAIRVYQSTVGPALPPACRFEPSCSRYAYEAIDRYGALRGSWLALRRLARCQPFGGHGYDPVP
jgi:putative membrane protein insertion efficiency factor